MAGTEQPDLRGLVPVLHDGLLITGAGVTEQSAVRLVYADGGSPALRPIGVGGRWLLDPRPEADVVMHVPGDAAPLPIQVGGWSGRLEQAVGGLITGWARNLRHPGRDTVVVAFSPNGVVAAATARAAENGRFRMILPASVTGTGTVQALSLGIAGSDFLLDEGQIVLPAGTRPAPSALARRAAEARAIRIKISTPNLKEAPMWGDFHFANSLAGAFERIGHQANVDTADAWYAAKRHEDVVITIRGRHRVKIDRDKINILWVISHPDRIPDEEYADYDYVAVASDVYADELAGQGLPVGVLHQATDATLFTPPEQEDRRQTCLFVGNSRKEYRTMVRWCQQKDIPLDLYGGGWEGILPAEAVRGTSVANTDLPRHYGAHMLLLNDHWDSMRQHGFLSNRLFDGSGTATPILTDPVAGLADVFGDTISEAGDIDSFARTVRNCLADPGPFLERARRARDIVMSSHTFDHRALELSDIIERIAARKRRVG